MIVAVVPVKRLEEAKVRLSGRLSPEGRRVLVLQLLEHVLVALSESSLIDEFLVVTPDADVACQARLRGAAVVRQEGTGLNRAIRLGRDEAVNRGAGTVLVVLGDLPFLEANDVDTMIGMSEDATVVVAPDRHERGTNALVLNPVDAIEPAFGSGSLEAHRSAARSSGLTVREYRGMGTRFDVDTPADLDEYRRITARFGQEISRRGRDASD